MMDTNRLEALRPKIRNMESMPTVPAIVQPLVEILHLPAEKVDLEHVVRLISYDGMIAAQCLRMANSPLFGRQNTQTVRAAIMALGLKRIEAILLGFCLNRLIPTSDWAFDPVTFWRHSLGCALVSGRMAKMIGYPDAEKAYLAGLLHDVGILVNTMACAEDFATSLRLARERHTALHRVEEEVMGFSHSQSGKIFAEIWQLPADIVEVIGYHHTVREAPATAALVPLVHLSDLLCRLRDLGHGYYEAMGVELAGEEAWTSLVSHYPSLAQIDLARLTMDIDGAMDEIISVVDTVFHA